MRILMIQHESFEEPAAYLNWARERGYKTHIVKVFEREQLPDSTEGYDFLLIMGGPQSPEEDFEKYPYYQPKREIKLIQSFILGDKAVIGACLGAQLIGEACGAPYEHSPQKEIGNISLHFTEAGKRDPLMEAFTEGMEVGSWHSDMPGLTEESEILAYSKGCPRQIVRYGEKIYAFQCHPEFTKEAVEGLIAAEESLQELSQSHPFVKSSREIEEENYEEMNQALYKFLDAFTEKIKSVSRD